MLTAIALYAGIAIWVLIAGPDEVVGHFGTDGESTRLDPTVGFVTGLTVTVAGLVGLFLALPALIKRLPIELINVPNRELWDTPELRALLARRMGADLDLIGALTVLLLTGMLVISTVAGFGIEIPGWVFPALTAAYLLVLVALLVSMFRGGRYVPPAEALASR